MPANEHIAPELLNTPAPSNGVHKADSLEEVRSEEVQEIMGKMPSWIIRRGIVVIGILLLVILTGAYFFKYPDVIPARVMISFINPPVKLVARSSLPIQELVVKNDEEVKQNQVLCIFSNPARYADVEQIATVSQRIDTMTDLSQLQRVQMPTGLQLGDLQSNYTELYQAVINYRFFLGHNVYGSKIDALSRQSAYYRQLNMELSNKDRLLQEQLKLQHNRFAADSSLLKDKVISRNEFEESRRKMLDQQMNTEGNKSNIIQNNLQQTEYEKNIVETSMQRQTEENTLQQKVRDAAKRFNGQYGQWLQNYVLKSPVAGKVSFFKFWKENQYVQAGESVMIVTPPTQEYVVRGDIGVDRSGKIKPGQKVLIKLSAYPFEEYGMLRGKVSSRTVVALDSAFNVEVTLDNGLLTNAGKQIPQQPQLAGVAEILTEDKSVLARLFEKVYGQWRR
ncbi:MAG TPA: HlyD family efflux transporter periplasmic adaptor subunit [Chitinophaga sp.]|uniref:HlyD family secretion protein n=1 Tax=Chitinophaga sp. TaxID=1869181 RepID=UPI002BDD7635|nr:HlyD family efflux transporter periplasmic adaptor subunit [Chitinophaga sp.]HVI43542.1 HlyD family efflux transporter periplasmic adaptor subunit [Chitinophaga sp.]